MIDHDRIKEAWERFHALNPHIYTELQRRAFALLAVGVRRFSVSMIYDAMRFDHAIATRGDLYKLNDHYTALYGRKLIAEHPVLDGIIKLRRRAVENFQVLVAA